MSHGRTETKCCLDSGGTHGDKDSFCLCFSVVLSNVVSFPGCALLYEYMGVWVCAGSVAGYDTSPDTVSVS